MQKFMIDIETTGIDSEKDDILQVAILEMTKFVNTGPWEAGRSLSFMQFSACQPVSVFAQTHQTELYAAANYAQPVSAETAHKYIVGFLKGCGAYGKSVYFCGRNASSFDIPFLLRKKYLKKDDYHYRIYELSGAIQLVEDITGFDHQTIHDLCKQKQALMSTPKGKAHEGLFDCHDQLNFLNALRLVVKEFMSTY